MKFDFKNLFILDMANNHQGDVNHGIKIIKEYHKVLSKKKVKIGFKFQFRNLKTFIHSDFIRSDIKHIKRFDETRLSLEDYKILFNLIKEKGYFTICTAFDEKSVDDILEFGFDIIKVASCSADDWPLLEKVSNTNLPTVVSTGGLKINSIDKIVSFAEHRNIDLALMHCVSIYPTKNNQCDLKNVTMLKRRYPKMNIGWSTHESPSNLEIIKIANAVGCEMFERHIGLETKKYKLNKYSSSPNQISDWIDSWKQSCEILGNYNRQIREEETKSLQELKRGVYLKRSMAKDSIVCFDDVYFSMPCQSNQIPSGEFKEGIKLKKEVFKDGMLSFDFVEMPKKLPADIIYEYVHKVKAMLNYANINLGTIFNVEYSHHYGVENFGKVGCILIECINREYCKKILIQLPGQDHPFHYHKLKEETFQVLWGKMTINIDGRVKELIPGDTELVLPGTWHKFNTNTGFIAEEISTTHYNNDSIYKDKIINEKQKSERKTIVKHWGRFQVKDKLSFDL